MANVNAPYGFLPIQSSVGASSNFEMVQARIAVADTTKIYRGDPVKLLATGYIAQWTATTAVSQLLGIFWGCSYLSTATGKMVQNNFWPGSDVATTAQETVQANIVPCTGSATPLFRVQTDAQGAAFADFGLNFDVGIGTGNTLNGQSGAYLDVAGASGTTATLPFRLVGFYGGYPGAGFGGVQPSGTNPYGSGGTGQTATAQGYNWVIVRANTLGAGTTGI